MRKKMLQVAVSLPKVCDFLRLLVCNHQNTVRQLMFSPSPSNPKQSFVAYYKYLELIRRITERIWAEPDLYPSSVIIETSVIRSLLIFQSFCEAYSNDCHLLKRIHFNFQYVIEIFQNIINKGLKVKHKQTFKHQR